MTFGCSASLRKAATSRSWVTQTGSRPREVGDLLGKERAQAASEDGYGMGSADFHKPHGAVEEVFEAAGAGLGRVRDHAALAWAWVSPGQSRLGPDGASGAAGAGITIGVPPVVACFRCSIKA